VRNTIALFRQAEAAIAVGAQRARRLSTPQKRLRFSQATLTQAAILLALDRRRFHALPGGFASSFCHVRSRIP
jgi:hypothetical protein